MKELTAKLGTFQAKFDELLVLQANSLQFEHEPSQSETQPGIHGGTNEYIELFGRTYISYVAISLLLRQDKTTLRKLLVDLSKEDVQLSQVISRCRPVGSNLFFLPS